MAELPLDAYVAATSECSGLRRGNPLPFGAHATEEGVNFAFFSRHALRVRLELFDHAADLSPVRTFDLNPARNRTGDVWHIWIEGIRPGQLYAFRVDGPHAPDQGHRFDFNKLLLDPYAAAVSHSTGTNGDSAPKSIFMAGHFEWHDDQPLKHPWSQTIIYETHVRGFTADASSCSKHPGTYRGFMEKISYLKELGVTAVELLPVQEFSTGRNWRTDTTGKQSTSNYWGYDPVAFFPVEGKYSSSGGVGQQTMEFKELVRALHQADIEVILDVVLTHTVEGNEHGPTLCFRGIDNSIFYVLTGDKCHYRDFTGTGNSINANHPVVCDHILDALRHWVLEMHVDGFRFDLASVLGRDEMGNLQKNPPLLARIAEDPILRETKLIAEAWDAAGAYEVGSFSERRWAEWNGRYRDDVRRFWRDDVGARGAFASRICGSEDIYRNSGKGPECSINYVACHDGFTLNDLVSYSEKHNESNGEDNRDGTDVNFSGNYGTEGETDDPSIELIRKRQIKNFILTLFVSRGVPMILGGDEFRRTQRGNNNAYCQDNETSWYNWNNLRQHQEIYRFVRGMISLRKEHPVLSENQFYSQQDIAWFDVHGRPLNWNQADGNLFACAIREISGDLYLIFNPSGVSADFILPSANLNKAYHLVVDTALRTNEIAFDSEHARGAGTSVYRTQQHSSVILVAEPQG